ncbi:unnamed protein product [Sphagnum balticum]
MDEFLPQILNNLSQIFDHSFSTSNYVMMEAILDSISSIAAINAFTEYYSRFMPALKNIVSMVISDTPQKISVKGKAIETMGDLLASIRDAPEFESECQTIMSSLLMLQQQIDREDTLNRAIFNVYENVVDVLKERFAVYSDFIFERAMEAARRNSSVQIIDEIDTQKQTKNPNMHKFVKLKLDLKIDGIKNLVLNTDTFEQKLEASNLLSCMARSMGTPFLKYRDSMIATIQELILYKSSKDIRSNMIESSKYLVINGATSQ